MLALIGRGDVCLGSSVGVGRGCDFKTRQGATKIDSVFFTKNDGLERYFLADGAVLSISSSFFFGRGG